MRLTRFIRNRSGRGYRPTAVIIDETTPTTSRELFLAFLNVGEPHPNNPSKDDALRIAEHCLDASSRFGCSHRMLLDIAATHLIAGKTVDEVLELVDMNAAVSYAAVARWSQ